MLRAYDKERVMNKQHEPAKRYAHVVGWGKYTPERILTNAELARMVDTSDEWIQQRTGIRERRIAHDHETTATQATHAAREALRRAGLTPDALDLIIVATSTPDYIFPATACLVQAAIGANRAGAFDVQLGCAGFVCALSIGGSMIQSGMIQRALIIGAETISRFLDWTDRNSCVLFGDGAGAFVLQSSPTRGGLLSYKLGADGSGWETLILPAGGSKHPLSQQTLDAGLHRPRMDGHAVFKFATRVMGKVAQEACELADLQLADIELFIPHQANLRIINTASKFLNLPDEKVMVNVDKYGNTSAASVPIAFCEAMDSGRIHAGDHVVLVGFGAGLGWAAATLQL
jgi:3-oxoacyl-[acyl-carrier-protein] synthase-3